VQDVVDHDDDGDENDDGDEDNDYEDEDNDDNEKSADNEDGDNENTTPDDTHAHTKAAAYTSHDWATAIQAGIDRYVAVFSDRVSERQMREEYGQRREIACSAAEGVCPGCGGW
jgi:hypothetical protein